MKRFAIPILTLCTLSMLSMTATADETQREERQDRQDARQQDRQQRRDARQEDRQDDRQLNDQQNDRRQVQARKVAPSGVMTLRASTLIGMEVRNGDNKELGTVNDFVVDMQQHNIRYLAISYGGFLGVGDKLFAIPIESFQLRHDAESDVNFLVLHIAQETLKSAPGFDQNNWPNFADASFSKEIDDYYRTHHREGKTDVEKNLNRAPEKDVNKQQRQ